MEKKAQFQKKKWLYDYELGENKLYNPLVGDDYTQPNGLSLHPVGVNFYEDMMLLPGKYAF